jgi:Family of unknown function (DUF5678)
MTVAERIQAEESLRDTLRQYAGEWVAVIDHNVVASAPRLEELLEQVAGQAEQVEVFQVAEHDFACFY